MDNTEETQSNSDKIWKIWKKSRLNSEKIWKIQKTIRNYPTQNRCIVNDKKKVREKKVREKKVRGKSTGKKSAGKPVAHALIYPFGVTSGSPIGHAQWYLYYSTNTIVREK